MSYTERDAWLDELAQGDWPFERWLLDSFPLRTTPNFSYFPDWRFNFSSDVRLLQQRLSVSFRGTDDVSNPVQLYDRLKHFLEVSVHVVQSAVEESRNDAYVSWMRHEVWLPVMDETNSADENPAQILIESIDYVGCGDELPQTVLAAVGLWFLGEYNAYHQAGDARMSRWALVQAAVLIAESELYRGADQERSRLRHSISDRNRIGADARHAANREKKQKGREIWESREWRFQADAAREMVKQLHIVEAVANRWVREFKRLGV